MIKKIVLSLFAVFFLFSLFSKISAQTNQVNLYFFWAKGCPHCEKEKIFLQSLEKKYLELEINDYEITTNKEGLDLMIKIGKELSADISGVPFTVVGEKFFTGFYDDETTGKKIEDAVICVLKNECEDIVSAIASAEQNKKQDVKPPIETLTIPVIGKIEIKDLSLPVLTFIIAALDGFNPCAMWTLIFLISLLLGMKNRKRMWILGIAFIVSSAFVYFLFLAAWLNFFLFLGFIVWVRLAIGLLAITAGGYYLRDYFTNRSGVCKVTGNEKRRKIFEKLKEITQRKQFAVALIGIILLAIAVNMVELICSAGLPAIYTQILSTAKLETWQYYAYLLFYIFIFMLDDLIVFFTAMITLKAVGFEGKYARYSHLIGGILMIVIGILMLFKPEWLMFG